MNCCDLKTLVLATPAAPYYRGIVTPGSRKKLTDGFWVVFLNPRQSPVGHYAGLRIKGKRAWFFNSLGYENGRRRVAKMLKPFTTTYNTHPLQSELTQVCALYVVYFFIRAQQGVAFGKIIGEFPHDELINDFFVISKITKYFQ